MANTLYFAVFPSAASAPTWALANIATNAGFSGSPTAYGTDAGVAATATDYEPTISWTGSLTPGQEYKIWAIWDDGANSSDNGVPQASTAFTALSAGSADLALTYAVLAASAEDLAVSYAVQNADTADLAITYAVETSATGTADLAVSYAVQAAGTADLALSYAVLGAGSADLASYEWCVDRTNIDHAVKRMTLRVDCGQSHASFDVVHRVRASQHNEFSIATADHVSHQTNRFCGDFRTNACRITHCEGETNRRSHGKALGKWSGKGA